MLIYISNAANKGGVVGGTKGTNSKVPLDSGSNRDEVGEKDSRTDGNPVLATSTRAALTGESTEVGVTVGAMVAEEHCIGPASGENEVQLPIGNDPAMCIGISKIADGGQQSHVEIGFEAEVRKGNGLVSRCTVMTNIAGRGKENFVYENPNKVVKRFRSGRF
ncbi:uncharacterized protein LOC131009602 [Salvia miltiorrhiza]|uniref:uncharacterized protein LOC131009602 n=1 Tax=Salvia miltiorrhiza TaxID=226208 RepID=UPI0025AD5645|nr:uncharacterized protein LOC131009602 [Salvia miltiorrhiza]